MKPQWAVIAVLAVFASVQWGQTWQRTAVINPHSPAQDHRLTVDSEAFLDGAVEMVHQNRFIFTPNIYHSVGMQVFFSWWIRGFEANAVLRLKQFNVIVFGLLIIGAAFFAFQSTSVPALAALAAALVASSSSLQAFSATLQYELIAGALLLLVGILHQCATPTRYFFMGLIVALLSVIRVHFLVVIPMLMILDRSSSNLRHHLWALAGFLLLALPWNLFYSLELGNFFFFQGDLHHQIHRYLNPASVGSNFPYPPTTEPSGWRFIWEQPLRYIWLLGQRFLYLSEMLHDNWHVPSIATRLVNSSETGTIILDKIWNILGGASMAFGIFTCRSTAAGKFIFSALLTVLIPQLVINSSFRFLLPLIPLFAVAQTLALKRLGRL